MSADVYCQTMMIFTFDLDDFILKRRRRQTGKVAERPKESEGESASVGREGTQHQS